MCKWEHQINKYGHKKKIVWEGCKNENCVHSFEHPRNHERTFSLLISTPKLYQTAELLVFCSCGQRCARAI